jgi:Glycosyl hydrolases family 28
MAALRGAQNPLPCLLFVALSLFLFWVHPSEGKIVVFSGKADDSSLATQWANGAILNATLNALESFDTFVLPNATYYTMGGILVKDLRHATIRIDGTLKFSNALESWPRSGPGQDARVLECLQFDNVVNVTFTSKGTGLLDGQGAAWWGIPFIGYAIRGENRPRLLNIGGSKDILVENLIFLNSPYWTFWCHGVDGLEVRNSHISAKRDNYDGHDLDDLSAFNTDGFDVAGRNVWCVEESPPSPPLHIHSSYFFLRFPFSSSSHAIRIHDCTIWNQDDCIAVKDGNPSENMLFERIHASGLGLTIGSIGGSTVRNITFRDCYMHHTYKGIYLKFRENGGVIEDVLYENIFMEKPEQWAIWIGPAQQADSSDICAAHPCSLCWPEIPFAECNAAADGIYRNITLRNVTVNKPLQSPGVILGSPTHPMENVVFDNVVVKDDPMSPWGKGGYKCEGVRSGIATGTTDPVPPCFEKRAALRRTR